MKQKLELPVLTTSHYFLRHPYLTDNLAVFAMRSSVANAQHLDRALAQNLQEADAFIEKILLAIENGEAYYWMITGIEDRDVLGSVCFWNLNNNRSEAEIGFELLPDHQGKGILQEIIPAILSFGFNHLKFQRITAEVAVKNSKSIALLKKFGFTQDDSFSSQTETVNYGLMKTAFMG